jgi:hypothetical protein
VRGEERKKHLRWCSKHQRVHGEEVSHQSCRFPNIDNKKRKKVIAVLDFESCDDGMIVVNTGCTDGCWEKVTATINEKLCISIDKKLIRFFLRNWDKWCNSPEYALYKILQEEL